MLANCLTLKRSAETSELSKSTAAWFDARGFALNDIELRSIESILMQTFDIQLRSTVLDQLARSFPVVKDRERSLIRVSNYVLNSRLPSTLLSQFERDPDALPSLLQILELDSFAIDWLIEDSDILDWLRMTAGQSLDRDHLVDLLLSELKNIDDADAALASVRRFRKRESLRVICAMYLHNMSIQTVCQQFAWVAEAIIESSFHFAVSESRTRGLIIGPDEVANLCIIAIGNLGAQEYDLASPIELLFLTDARSNDATGETGLRATERIAERTIELLQDPHGAGFQVSLPLQKISGSESTTQLAIDWQSWLQSVESHGRTWQRMAMVKAKPIAGNSTIASKFFAEVPNLVYRRYLNRADIAGIGAFRRKIDRKAKTFDDSFLLHGKWSIELLIHWKSEIELLIQFLQLINGGELQSIRMGNTLQAIDALGQQRCLTDQECAILRSAYELLSNCVVRAQSRTGGDANAELVDDRFDAVLEAIAIDLGVEDKDDGRTRAFHLKEELNSAYDRVKQIRNHLRGEVFVDENQAADETDLILDPDPDPAWVDELLRRSNFTDTQLAYQYIAELGREEVSVLSTRRCRHFLSIIAPQLLRKIGQTPDPDLTLENLGLTCRSLGAKGILWELFSVHEPSMDLYVRLCGASPYLVGILTNNPGMIDELLDSLMLNRLPTNQQLSVMLHELCRGAEDIEQIVRSFKNTMHLNVGVRDILGKESIVDTHRALADIAEVSLQEIVQLQFNQLAKRFGVPTTEQGDECKFVVLTLGKFGAREPNYHSDVTILVLFDRDGMTRPLGATRHHEAVASELFFHQLAQRIVQTSNRLTRSGRLYEMQNWIVSESRNTLLAWKLDELISFVEQSTDTAELRQQILTARPVIGDAAFQKECTLSLQQLVRRTEWTDDDTYAILETRRRLESTANKQNLKRGAGGTLDVEYLAQLLSLQHAASHPDLLVPGTLESLSRLAERGIIDLSDSSVLSESYNFLRSVESGLRLMNTSARHDLPTNELDLSRLAYIQRVSTGQMLAQSVAQHRKEIRRCFIKYFGDQTSNH